jgi:hypothetical protein
MSYLSIQVQSNAIRRPCCMTTYMHMESSSQANMKATKRVASKAQGRILERRVDHAERDATRIIRQLKVDHICQSVNLGSLTVQLIDDDDIRVDVGRGCRHGRHDRQVFVRGSKEGGERRLVLVRLFPDGILDEDKVALVARHLKPQKKKSWLAAADANQLLH